MFKKLFVGFTVMLSIFVFGFVERGEAAASISLRQYMVLKFTQIGPSLGLGHRHLKYYLGQIVVVRMK